MNSGSKLLGQLFGCRPSGSCEVDLGHVYSADRGIVRVPRHGEVALSRWLPRRSVYSMTPAAGSLESSRIREKPGVVQAPGAPLCGTREGPRGSIPHLHPVMVSPLWPIPLVRPCTRARTPYLEPS